MFKTVDTVEATDNLEVPYDTSDKEQVNKVRKKAARTRADRLSFVEAAMTTEQGRAWFYDLLKFGHVFNVPYVSGDTHATSFKCGEMNVALRVLDDIQTIAPTQYLTMISENKTRNG